MEFQTLQLVMFFSCATAMLSKNVVPVFLISNVSGLNLHLLKQFLNVLPSSSFSKLKQDEISLNALLFSIEEVYHVPQVIFSNKFRFFFFCLEGICISSLMICLESFVWCYELSFQVNIVVCGVLTDGILREKDAIQIGPFKDGNYHSGRIESIRRNKQPVRFVRPGEAASMALAVDEIYVQNIRRVSSFFSFVL